MSADDTLSVIDQREVVFYDDTLIAVRAADGHVYVSVRHLCDALGLNRRPQVLRIQRQHVLAKGYRQGPIDSAGGRQTAGLLRVDLIPLWLSGVDTRRVKDTIQAKLERYQEEAARVLWEAFQTGQLTADTPFDELLQGSSDAVQAYKMLQAMLKLARQQILIEARLDDQALQLADLGERLQQVEATLGHGERQVTPEQASQISQAVKTVALALARRSGRNEYGGVYGELYRRFGITSYKLLPAAKFGEAMAFLTNWHQAVSDDETPF